MKTLWTALTEPHRFQIVELLRDGPLTVGEITERLGMQQPQVSKHLRVLSGAAIVEVQPQANRRIYTLRHEPFQELEAWLHSFRSLWEERFDRLDDYLLEVQVSTSAPATEVRESMFDYQSLSPEPGEQEFVVERHFSAPRFLMFQVFTQAEHLKRWWAPQPYTIPVCTIDLRPGGIWHYSMRSPEGQDHWSRSVYREIVPPEKLVYTSTFADEHANPIKGIPEHLTTILLTEEAGKTKATARIQFSSAEAMKLALDMGMQQGMNMTWDYLIEYVQKLQAQ